MKRGTTVQLPVNINLSLDLVEKIVIKLSQGNVSKLYEYPSDEVVKLADKKFGITITEEDSYLFGNGRVELDTKVYLTGSSYNPQTAITSFRMDRTLFKKGETDG